MKKAQAPTTTGKKGAATMSAEEAGVPSDAAAYLKSLEDSDVIERVRCVINDAHVFKLPPRQTAGGWRGADWDQEVWQGMVKVVERGDLTVVLLVDRNTGAIFAVCPVKEGAVDRCVDSSRYFVVRVENANGRHMFIGMAFNERNDAFDFNTSLEDSRKERELEKNPVDVGKMPAVDYSLKEGEKIKVKIGIGKSSIGTGDRSDRKTKPKKTASGTGGGFLKPSSKDTPRRASGI